MVIYEVLQVSENTDHLVAGPSQLMVEVAAWVVATLAGLAAWKWAHRPSHSTSEVTWRQSCAALGRAVAKRREK